eukprot:gene4043-14122_t
MLPDGLLPSLLDWEPSWELAIVQMKSSTKPSQKEVRLAEPSQKDKKASEAAKKAENDALFALTIKQPKVPAVKSRSQVSAVRVFPTWPVQILNPRPPSLVPQVSIPSQFCVDPKSVLCEFFRHGQCNKGFKCKYSHDLAIERKGEKIDLFTDQREMQEGMDDWDQETLEKAIAEKHANEVNSNNATAIICKFFLESVEKKQYGWFWKCPTGTECKYRHALPQGYVLKSQMKELLDEEKANMKDASELIEEERAKVDAKTPITEAVFRAWHYKKTEQRRHIREEELEERRKKGILSGREIFMQDGFTAQGANGADENDMDADGADDSDMLRNDEAEIEAMLLKASQDAIAARERAAAMGLQTANYDDEDHTPAATTLTLNEDEAALFDDDDDEDIDMEDDDDEDLDGLEEGVKNTHV